MPKYIKKPVVVEAEEYKPGMEDGQGTRFVISKEEFQSNYELVEGE